MKNNTKIHNRILSVVLGATMVLGCITPSDVVFADGEGILTINQDTAIRENTVIDDSGALCDSANLSQINVTSEEPAVYPTCNLLTQGFGNKSLNITAGGNYTFTVGTPENVNASLTCNSIVGRLLNYGTVYASSITYGGSGSGRSYSNNGDIYSSTVSLPGSGNTLTNASGAIISTSTLDVGINSTVENRGSIETTDLTLTCDDTYGARFQNYGVFTMHNFAIANNSNAIFTNNVGGQVRTINATVNTAYHNVNNYGDFFVEEELNIKGSTQSSAGTFSVLPDTVINSEGPVFTIKNDELGSIQLSGTISGEKAINFLGEDITTITVDEPDTVYYGQDYDFSNLVHGIPNDYDGNITFYYRQLEEGTFVKTKFTEPGNYVFYVEFTGSSKYKDTVSDITNYSINYLPIEKCYISGTTSLVTYDGVHNDYYVADSFSVKPADGFSIKKNDGSFSSSLSFTRADINPDNLYIIKNSAGAQTDVIDLETLAPDVFELIFDDDIPEVSNAVIDGVEKQVTSGSTVEGKTASFTVSDENLDKAVVTVDASSTTTKYTEETTTGTVEIKGTRGKTSDVTVTVYDKAERTKTLGFKLKYPVVTPTASIKIFDTTVGSDFTPVLDTESDGKDRAVFEYKLSGEDDSAYTETKPVKAGSYVVRASIPETEYYESITCTAEFSINRKVSEIASVSVGNLYLGQDITPIVDTDSDGKNNAKFLYKVAGSPDSTYTGDIPNAVGDYVVQAIIPQTDMYESTSCTGEFEVSYLDAPANAYTLSGVKGNNDYYTSDVTVNAADDYLVSNKLNGAYSTNILYTGKNQKVYLKRKTDGAMTDAITVTEDCKIDKVAPTISEADKTSVYSDELTVTISDDHLSSLTMDGEKLSIKSSEVTAKLDPENGVKTFIIKAEDEAGNNNKAQITVMATWLRNRIIPGGVLVPLEGGEAYKLGSGKWTVTDDTTVYTGGGTVYVNSSKKLTFTEVN